MPGSLSTGYLRAQQYEQQQEELAEEKKREKSEETLNQLRIKKLTREMDRAIEEFRHQQRMRQEINEATARIQAGEGTELDRALMGLKMPEPEKAPYPWMGTPYEEAGARKQFYISPEGETGQTKFGEAFGNIRKYFELTQPEVGPPTPPEILNQKALDQAIKAVYPKMFGKEEIEPQYTGKQLIDLGDALQSTLGDSLKALGGERIRGEVFGETGAGVADETKNKTKEVADNLLRRIKNGEFDREYIQNYIDENAEEYRAQGVDPDLLKQMTGF